VSEADCRARFSGSEQSLKYWFIGVSIIIGSA